MIWSFHIILSLTSNLHNLAIWQRMSGQELWWHCRYSSWWSIFAQYSQQLQRNLWIFVISKIWSEEVNILSLQNFGRKNIVQRWITTCYILCHHSHPVDTKYSWKWFFDKLVVFGSIISDWHGSMFSFADGLSVSHLSEWGGGNLRKTSGTRHATIMAASLHTKIKTGSLVVQKDKDKDRYCDWRQRQIHALWLYTKTKTRIVIEDKDRDRYTTLKLKTKTGVVIDVNKDKDNEGSLHLHKDKLYFPLARQSRRIYCTQSLFLPS